MLINKFDKDTIPQMLPVLADNIPQELKEIDNWLNWKWKWTGKKWSKPPVNGTSTNATLTFEEALANAQNSSGVLGVGFSLDGNDICGVDLDGVLTNKGKVQKQYRKLLKPFNDVYCEVSPGGQGLRMFGKGSPNTVGAKEGNPLEVYTKGRYLTVTGRANGTAGFPIINIEKKANQLAKKLQKILTPHTRKKRAQKLATGDEIDHEILNLLPFIDAGGYEDWYAVGQSLHYETGGSETGLSCWDNWSMKCSEKYEPGACRKKWLGIKNNNETLRKKGTIKYLKEHWVKKALIRDNAPEVRSFKEIKKEKVKPIVNLMDPWLMEGSINMIHATRGLGKTHFCIAIALALSAGGNFLKWCVPIPKRVLYVDGEMPFPLLKEYLHTQEKATGLTPKKNNLQVITIDKQKEGYLPSLSEPEGKEWLQKAIEAVAPEVIIFDSLDTCFNVNEDKGGYWNDNIKPWLMKLRHQGIDIIIVHHDNKSGLAQSGKSDKERILSSVIHLKAPVGIDAEKGATFIISFTKGRHFWGEDKIPFEARLGNEKGELYSKWTYVSEETTTIEKVVYLSTEGNTPVEISKHLDISAVMIRKHLKNAIKQGLIDEKNVHMQRRKNSFN